MQSDIKEIHFTPYRVSTITCNANIGQGINLDLSMLFKNIEIKDSHEDNAFIWVQHLKEDEDNYRGIYPKKKRKTKTESNGGKKSRFDNQITAIYRYNSDYMPNIKIFKNGNIQVTGIKDVTHPRQIVENVISNIIRIYNNFDRDILLTGNIGDLHYDNFKIRMINTDFKIYQDSELIERFNIKRKELHNILISSKYNNKSSFQPGIYQGVKLEYFWNSSNEAKDGICRCSKNCFGKNCGHGDGNCKKVTVAIFESGSILITGGITFEQVNDAYSYICKIITENKNLLKKQVLLDMIAEPIVLTSNNT